MSGLFKLPATNSVICQMNHSGMQTNVQTRYRIIKIMLYCNACSICPTYYMVPQLSRA